MSKIHPTAIISEKAIISDNVQIGPYCIIDDQVKIGSNTIIGSHSVIAGNTQIGSDCMIHSHVSIGAEPQDLSYKGESTETIIGNKVVLREFVTIHRGTAKGRGKTEVLDNSFLMNYVHIGHDCKVGKNCIIANSTSLAGHVILDNNVNISALYLAHQFVEIGEFVMASGMSGTRKSIPPYVLVEGRPSRIMKVNVIGLERAGFSKDLIKMISQAYKLIQKKEIKLALAEIKEMTTSEYLQLKNITDFYDRMLNSSRGVISFLSLNDEDMVSTNN